MFLRVVAKLVAFVNLVQMDVFATLGKNSMELTPITMVFASCHQLINLVELLRFDEFDFEITVSYRIFF